MHVELDDDLLLGLDALGRLAQRDVPVGVGLVDAGQGRLQLLRHLDDVGEGVVDRLLVLGVGRLERVALGLRLLEGGPVVRVQLHDLARVGARHLDGAIGERLGQVELLGHGAPFSIIWCPVEQSNGCSIA